VSLELESSVGLSAVFGPDGEIDAIAGNSRYRSISQNKTTVKICGRIDIFTEFEKFNEQAI
jgi:hypothetical protein